MKKLTGSYTSPRPIAGYGPFVMNSEAQIEQAIRDFEAGRFGRMTPAAAERAPA